MGRAPMEGRSSFGGSPRRSDWVAASELRGCVASRRPYHQAWDLP